MGLDGIKHMLADAGGKLDHLSMGSPWRRGLALRTFAIRSLSKFRSLLQPDCLFRRVPAPDFTARITQDSNTLLPIFAGSQRGIVV